MARPPPISSALEGPATRQRASASFVTEASGNSRVFNHNGDQHVYNTYEGYAEMHSEMTLMRHSIQRLEGHVADLKAQTNADDTIAVKKTHLAILLFA
ncbi:hypothetical protein FIBSPDRAFT_956281 [Athelia psychrophila]|uniref:Uncharacterized protein n=1 Tax=Athelia psychrophila TaxID=1759441 RepID=A0A166H5E9_9AGAM|nr:hypothetical protein FIBSPDRAFT_956281 [Fibularhizoctonia sp. CBS 109695]